MKSLIVGQSGGPTSVINASLAGVYYGAKKKGFDKVYGMVNGIEGLLQDHIIDLDEYFLDKDNLELLKRTPSSFLGSCRFKLGSIKDHEETYEKVFEILDKHSIDSLIYIGGNDSMDTVESLSDYAELKKKRQNFIGVPKTIDNDLPITDHCPGFGSACKYIATTLREVIQDNNCYGTTKPTVAIVEIMGRHAGWLTSAAALAKDETCEGVDAIYLPEIPFNLDTFVEETTELLKKKPSLVIAVSEGIKTEDDKFICELNASNLAVDSFGHKELAGCAETLCKILKEKLGIKTRAITLSTLQRAAAHLASKTDLDEAYNCGVKGAELAFDGQSGKMVYMDRVSNDPYKIEYKIFDDIHKIANIEKKIPLEWIDVDNNYVKDELVNYLRPLIQGEVKQIYKNGVPQHINMKK
ncbi:MAG: 6-phosphofructokinase [Bacilli bacterium]|nr:6-phosphofructokinase [Bacilli bacterium]